MIPRIFRLAVKKREFWQGHKAREDERTFFVSTLIYLSRPAGEIPGIPEADGSSAVLGKRLIISITS